MAIIRPGRAGKRRLSLTGAVSVRVYQGRTVAQAWPRPRGTPKLAYQRATLDMLRVSQRAVKQIPARESAPMDRELKAFLNAHRGLQGSAAIRLRDWLTQVVYGRAWAVAFPDGRVMWSQRVYRECSDFLDWTLPRIGSLLTRTDRAWLPTEACAPGAVCKLMPSIPITGCCPPASIPDRRWGAGGV